MTQRAIDKTFKSLQKEAQKEVVNAQQIEFPWRRFRFKVGGGIGAFWPGLIPWFIWPIVCFVTIWESNLLTAVCPQFGAQQANDHLTTALQIQITLTSLPLLVLGFVISSAGQSRFKALTRNALFRGTWFIPILSFSVGTSLMIGTQQLFSASPETVFLDFMLVGSTLVLILISYFRLFRLLTRQTKLQALEESVLKNQTEASFVETISWRVAIKRMSPQLEEKDLNVDRQPPELNEWTLILATIQETALADAKGNHQTFVVDSLHKYLLVYEALLTILSQARRAFGSDLLQSSDWLAHGEEWPELESVEDDFWSLIEATKESTNYSLPTILVDLAFKFAGTAAMYGEFKSYRMSLQLAATQYLIRIEMFEPGQEGERPSRIADNINSLFYSHIRGKLGRRLVDSKNTLLVDELSHFIRYPYVILSQLAYHAFQHRRLADFKVFTKRISQLYWTGPANMLEYDLMRIEAKLENMSDDQGEVDLSPQDELKRAKGLSMKDAHNDSNLALFGLGAWIVKQAREGRIELSDFTSYYAALKIPDDLELNWKVLLASFSKEVNGIDKFSWRNWGDHSKKYPRWKNRPDFWVLICLFCLRSIGETENLFNHAIKTGDLDIVRGREISTAVESLSEHEGIVTAVAGNGAFERIDKLQEIIGKINQDLEAKHPYPLV